MEQGLVSFQVNLLCRNVAHDFSRVGSSDESSFTEQQDCVQQLASDATC
jgi:hypothetical protein